MTGLYRFDGVSFEPMPRSTGRRAQSETVDTLLATASGDLWVGHDWGGVSLVRGGRHVAIDDEVVGSTMRRILRAPDGAIWTIAEGQNVPIIARFASGKWRVFAKGQHIPSALFGSAAIARDGVLWLTAGNRLWYLDAIADRLVPVGAPFPAGGRVAAGPDGQVWLVMPDGLHRVSSPSGTRAATIGPVGIALPNAPGEQQIAFDHDGALWSISRARGVARYGPAPAANRPGPAPQLDLFLTDRSAQLVPSASLFDREGNLWIGSELGLEQFTPASFALAPTVGGAATTRWAGIMVMRDGARDVYIRQGENLFRVQPGLGATRLPYRVFPDDIPCPSRAGGIWIRDRPDSIVRIGTSASRRLPLAPEARAGGLAGGCAEDGLGRLWVPQMGSETFGYLTEQGRGAVRLGDESGRVPNETISDSDGRILVYLGRGSLWRTDGRKVEALWRRHDISIEFIEFLYQGPRYLLMAGPGGLARYDGRRIQVLPGSRFPFLAHLSGAVQTQQGETWLQNAQGVVRLATADRPGVRRLQRRPSGAIVRRG